MRTRLKLLESLQEIDLKLDSRKVEREGLMQEIAALDLRAEEARREIAEKESEADGLREEKEGLDATLALESENISRSESRLSEIKTQKEYQAVLKEISSAKKVRAELEDQILQRMGRIDELSAEIAGMQENLRALEENTSVQKNEVQQRVDLIDREISADVAERDATTKGLSPSVVNRYNTLRERRQGVAVVEARGGCCLGCNMNIPPQVYNNLYRGEDMITCPHCQRVLFLRRDEE